MSTPLNLIPSANTYLSTEGFLHCLSFVDYQTLCRAERVSHAWHQTLAVDREYDFDLTQLNLLKQLAQENRLTVLIDNPIVLESWIAKDVWFEPHSLNERLCEAVKRREKLSVLLLLQFKGHDPSSLRKAFVPALLPGAEDILDYGADLILSELNPSMRFCAQIPAVKEALGMIPLPEEGAMRPAEERPIYWQYRQ